MKLPKIKKTPTGYSCRLRVNGKDITLRDTERASLIDRVRQAKTQGLHAKKKTAAVAMHPTIREAIDLYCENRSNGLSPATVRKYKNIQRNQFQGIMGIQADRLLQEDLQAEANRMMGRYAKKTVSTSMDMLLTVIRAYGGEGLKSADLGTVFSSSKDKKEYMEPSEILRFVAVAKNSPRNIELLLALSSARIAEIDGLYWENMLDDRARIRQVRLITDDGKYVIKQGAKEEASVREIKFLIPELQEAVAQRRKPEGKVMECCQEVIRRECKRVCTKAGIEPITVHGLRHSFASLTAYLKIPITVSQEMGGWANDKIMLKIYTHVFDEGRAKAEQAFTDFFRPQNALRKIKPGKHLKK